MEGENSNEFSYLIEKFLAKKLKEKLLRSMTIGNGMKMFERFWRKSSRLCRKIQTNQNLMHNFHRAQKFKKGTPLEAYLDTVRACLGVAAWGFRGRTPRTLEKFSKMFIKTSMQNNNFRPIFHNFNEYFPKTFWRNFEKNLEVCIYRGFGGQSPPPSPRSSRFY